MDTSKVIDKIIASSFSEIEEKNIGYEDCGQYYNGKWYTPDWGCDTLSHIAEILTYELGKL